MVDDGVDLTEEVRFRESVPNIGLDCGPCVLGFGLKRTFMVVYCRPDIDVVTLRVRMAYIQKEPHSIVGLTNAFSRRASLAADARC